MKSEIHIFHLQRKDGTPLFLHPFSEPAKMLKVDAETTISACYGKDPRPESITMLRNELYRMVEAAVKQWIMEKRFIPRFLLSSALFMVLYFFLSLVVRDPLPMIDELLISLAASIGLYFFLSRRATGSKEAASKRIVLRERIDAIYFEHNPVIEKVEQLLGQCEEMTPEDLSEFLKGDPEFVSEEEKEVIGKIMAYLETLFSGKAGKREARILERRQGTSSNLALFGLYRLLKKKSGATPRY
jgi:hypothetical protein